jgi:hypothetical protein
MFPNVEALVAWRASRSSAKDSSPCSDVSLLGMVIKEKEFGGKVSWLEENTLETRPVKTIELMKTPKDNCCAQVRNTRKEAI